MRALPPPRDPNDTIPPPNPSSTEWCEEQLAILEHDDDASDRFDFDGDRDVRECSDPCPEFIELARELLKARAWRRGFWHETTMSARAVLFRSLLERVVTTQDRADVRAYDDALARFVEESGDRAPEMLLALSRAVSSSERETESLKLATRALELATTQKDRVDAQYAIGSKLMALHRFAHAEKAFAFVAAHASDERMRRHARDDHARCALELGQIDVYVERLMAIFESLLAEGALANLHGESIVRQLLPLLEREGGSRAHDLQRKFYDEVRRVRGLDHEDTKYAARELRRLEQALRSEPQLTAEELAAMGDRCDFCTERSFETKEPCLRYKRAQTLDGRWICFLCYGWLLCPDKTGKTCGFTRCDHRPVLATAWIKLPHSPPAIHWPNW
jgi:hypothetical protein